MKLITQPDEGLQPLLDAVDSARREIDIAIFRFDCEPLERALATAVERGVAVRALVAHTNTGGGQRLRDLEHRLLGAGVIVARTNDDLVRYHGKLMLVDKAELYILGFNFTALDFRSRSFGVHLRNPKIVQDIDVLIQADMGRTTYTPTSTDLVVSPVNSRTRLAQLIRRAKRTIEIYDPHLSDDRMLGLLTRRAIAGVAVRIIGKVEKKWQCDHFDARSFAGGRLHVRAIVADGRTAFIGSQSLRKLELDRRREVGLVIRDLPIVKAIREVFEEDWARTQASE